jgi:hypothetical protein
MFKKQLIFSIICIIFLTSELTNAQKDTGAAENLALKLQQKVLLTDEQTNKVREIISEYIKNPEENNLNSARLKIEDLLNEKQKAKYEIIKNDWWDTISKEIKRVNK